MSEFTTKDIHNFAFVGHGTAGKTMLAEAMLFNAGGINRMGTIDNGNTVSDYRPDEIERQISINSSLLTFHWNKKKINVLDCPGYADFFGEVLGALRVSDMALIVVNGVSNIEVGTEQAFQAGAEYGLPPVIVVNMLDKEHADFKKVVATARERFGAKVFPLALPLNEGPTFNRIVDVLRKELHTYKADGSGKYDVSPVPDDMVADIDALHAELIEFVAESDDTLLEKFFEQDALSEDELRAGLHGAIMNGSLIPVFPVSALQNVGVLRLMDVLTKYGPCAADVHEIKGVDKVGGDEEIVRPATVDAPVVALVFKTVSEAHVGELSFFRLYSGVVKAGDDLRNTSRHSNERMGSIYSMNGRNRTEMGAVIAGDIAAVVKLKETHTGNTLVDPKHRMVLPGLNLPEPKVRSAVKPKAKGDEAKISTGLSTFHEEDPTFIFEFDPELKQTIIAGQGELHMEVIIARLKQRFGVEVDITTPRVPYRETITSRGESKYRHKKQSGGAGQFAEVWMYIEPLPTGSGIVFESKLKGQSIDRVFIPSIEKGVKSATEEGVVAGYHVVDVKAVVYDGKQHPVDSKDIAFQIAGRGAFKEAFKEAKPRLLEPIYTVDILVPEEFMGDVMGDVSSRRGKVLGMDSDGHLQKVSAHIPLANLDGYATSLRSMTGGRGIHSQRFAHYEPVPADEQKRVIKAHQKELEEGG